MENAKSILNNLNKKLTYFKLPAYIHFTDSLPITSSQKIMKKDLIKKIKKEKNRNFYDFSELKRKLNTQLVFIETLELCPKPLKV